MALPPPWLAIVAALNATSGQQYSSQRAQDIVAYFEAQGWRLVPHYAVDETQIPQGLVLTPEQENNLPDERITARHAQHRQDLRTGACTHPGCAFDSTPPATPRATPERT